MSKITFRADDDLVEELEALEASKSEAMREALRAYLDGEPAEQPERDADRTADIGGETAIDDIVRKHVDDLLTERLEELERVHERQRGRGRSERDQRAHARESQDVNVTISLEGRDTRGVDVSNGQSQRDPARTREGSEQSVRHGHDRDHAHDHTHDRAPDRSDTDRDQGPERTCGQCGEHVDGDHVYCPNCGEKVSRRLFCECGDELRSDWAFCPGCGRRTPSADVLESNSR